MRVMGTEVLPLSQVSVMRLQVVPFGQQWKWSTQHTACRQNNLSVVFHDFVKYGSKMQLFPVAQLALK